MRGRGGGGPEGRRLRVGGEELRGGCEEPGRGGLEGEGAWSGLRAVGEGGAARGLEPSGGGRAGASPGPGVRGEGWAAAERRRALGGG